MMAVFFIIKTLVLRKYVLKESTEGKSLTLSAKLFHTISLKMSNALFPLTNNKHGSKVNYL